MKFSDIEHGNRGGGPLHSVATPDMAGFMSADDKTALDAAAPLASPEFTGNVDIGGTIAFTGVITPTELSASIDDYNPTGLGTASVLRISADANDYRIKGIVGGSEGRQLVIHNIDTTNYFYLEHEAASSTAANRITVEGSSWVTMFPGSLTILMYDNTSQRWRCIKGPMAANSASMEGASANSVYVSPLVFHRHPAAAKCWGTTTGGGTPTLAASYNVTSITDTGVGQLTVTIATDFSSANWAGCVSAVCSTLDNKRPSLYSKAAGSVVLEAYEGTAVLADPAVGFDWMFFGDQ